MAQKHRYILIGVNVLYIALLLLFTALVGRPDTLPWTAIRAKIDSSQTFEDLRPRAQHAITALEAGDRAILALRGITMWLCVIGVSFAVMNLTLLYIFSRRTLPD